NFEIGRRIVEHEQKGAKRAKYGAELLHELSASLTEEFGRGFSVTNLKLMRQFFTENQFRNGQSVTDQFGMLAPISQSPTDQSTIFQSVTEKSESFPFLLSWTHYVELLGLRSQRNANIYPRIPSGCRRLVAGKPPNSHVLISKRQLIDLLIE
ncbi:MAG: DUF1016 N-terminal domain-containing protein, partial [Akkermansiaceae bacterium]|nr:DUF1016 N-terminal domain-containing protein [Akkermansiaceae bacterium]